VKGATDNSDPQSRSLSEAEREALFKRLHLAHMRRIYQDVAVQAEKEGWSYADFLGLLLAEEVAGRKQTRLQRRTRSAHFPFLKTIDEFDFSLQSTLRLALLGSLAVALGYRAIQNGFETLFTTAAELIEDLSNASPKRKLQESLATYTHPHVLIIDEVGYLTYAQDAANVLFHVVNNRHLRRRPMIFTTNKPLSEWGKVLHDEDLAAAILDRVLERGRFIRLDGPSGRTRHLKLEEPLPASSERFRISGNNGSEFPEPTGGREALRRLRRGHDPDPRPAGRARAPSLDLRRRPGGQQLHLCRSHREPGDGALDRLAHPHLRIPRWRPQAGRPRFCSREQNRGFVPLPVLFPLAKNRSQVLGGGRSGGHITITANEAISSVLRVSAIRRLGGMFQTDRQVADKSLLRLALCATEFQHSGVWYRG
jgi:DNA replication protein DnaC